MQNLVHLALSPAGQVMAHFHLSSDAQDYCERNGYTHVPFNLRNRDNASAPLVGSTYKA